MLINMRTLNQIPQKCFRACLLLVLLVTSTQVFSQYIIQQTMSAGGGKMAGGNYFAQIVGQSSIVSGTSQSPGAVFRQGFKQPLGLSKTNTPFTQSLTIAEEKPWSVELFPNPVYDMATIRLSSPSATEVIVRITDLMAQTIWENVYPQSSIMLSIDQIKHLKSGSYILQVYQLGGCKNVHFIKEN
jgi:hypothetical protein